MSKSTNSDYMLKRGQKVVPISEARNLSKDPRYKILWCPTGNYHGKDGGYAVIEEL
jgi:hypothetical protein